jgi:hypothetical protein
MLAEHRPIRIHTVTTPSLLLGPSIDRDALVSSREGARDATRPIHGRRTSSARIDARRRLTSASACLGICARYDLSRSTSAVGRPAGSRLTKTRPSPRLRSLPPSRFKPTSRRRLRRDGRRRPAHVEYSRFWLVGGGGCEPPAAPQLVGLEAYLATCSDSEEFPPSGARRSRRGGSRNPRCAPARRAGRGARVRGRARRVRVAHLDSHARTPALALGHAAFPASDDDESDDAPATGPGNMDASHMTPHAGGTKNGSHRACPALVSLRKRITGV